jgi:hypothetical protein
MSEVRLTLEGGPGFEPGSELRGEAHWNLDRAAAHVSLRLFWYTEGKGEEDLFVVIRLELATGARNHTAPFRLELPRDPYSCSGRLVSIRWALELVADDEGIVERKYILIGPGGREVRVDQEVP